jgi:arylsulfatase A-like enzyme
MQLFTIISICYTLQNSLIKNQQEYFYKWLSKQPNPFFLTRTIPFCLLLTSCILGFSASELRSQTAARKANPQNLVIFLSDDHSQLDATLYGATDVRTPNMDRIASEGMLFTKAFVASPTCAPSRAALLTGLAPARNGAEANHSKPRPEIRKLPSYLQELGYEVVAFGKVSHYEHTKDYGFDYFAHDGFHDHASIPAALEFLKEWKNEKPLCLFVGSNWPHVPWPENHEGYGPDQVKLPAKFIDTPEMRVARAQYYSAISNMDTELGLIYDAAREKFGNELVFLHTSDHGAQLPFNKWNLYDAGIRVPFIAVWPGVISPESHSSAMIQWTDLLPTLIELAGGEVSDGLDGRSFAPVLRGERNTHHQAIFTTHSSDMDYNVYPMRSVRTENWKYIRNLHPEFQYATHLNRAPYAPSLIYWRSWERAAETSETAAEIVRKYRQRPPEELYDLRNDPHELHNLAQDPRHAERLHEMSEQLDAWMEKTGDPQKVFGKPILLGEKAELIYPVKKDE